MATFGKAVVTVAGTATVIYMSFVCGTAFGAYSLQKKLLRDENGRLREQLDRGCDMIDEATENFSEMAKTTV